MVKYCLELPYGKWRHFPAGTYNEQMNELTGTAELGLIDVVHSVWYAFSHVPMRKWGDFELHAAKLAEPETPEPEKPTRVLDNIVRWLWPASFWQHRVIWKMREMND